MSTSTAPQTDNEKPHVDWGPSYLDGPGWSWVPHWLSPYLRPEMLAMLMLGFASGLPLYLFYSKTSIWLRDSGIERSTIGFFYWIGLAYTLKWVWAPVIDKTIVPLLGPKFGHRRSWMMVSIAGTVIGMLILATADPTQGLIRVLIGAGLVAFSGATLDVSIDAWRIESAPTEAQANMAASYSFGYRGALMFSGLGVSIAGLASWTVAFTVMAGGMAACALLVLLISEPANRKEPAHLDELPFFAGPANAVAIATALFIAARLPRMFGFDILLVDIVAIAGVLALLLGRLAFRGTQSSIPYRFLLAGIGAAFVYSHEIAELTQLSVESAFFPLVLAGISLSIVGIYGYVVYRLVAASMTRARTDRTAEEMPRGKLYALFATPLMQVWGRFGAVLVPILILVLIYRTSDFTMGVMAGPLYIDLGYDKTIIGAIQSVPGVVSVFVGLVIGGFVANIIGVMRSLVVGAILTLLTNGFYAYFAAHATGDDPMFLTLAICADNVAGGFVTTVFIAYLSSLVDPAFAATQYALFSSLYALLNKLVAGLSGVLADAVGYVWFFLITASYAIPAMILVLIVMYLQREKDAPGASLPDPAE